MAKLSETKIGKEDIEEYLANYSDFSFEVRVLKKLTELGFTCQHGGTYKDPVTGKDREFDIRASSFYPVAGKNIRYCLCLSVECKNFRENFPLVIHCTPRSENECYQDLVWSSPPSPSGGIVTSSSSTHPPTIFDSRLVLSGAISSYKVGDPVGKSYNQVGRRVQEKDLISNDAEVFEKISQAINASFDIIMLSQNAGTQENSTVVSSILPVLVIPKDRLWKVTYENSGNVIEGPTPVTWVSYYIGKSWSILLETQYGVYNQPYRLSHLEIIELDNLDALVRAQTTRDRLSEDNLERRRFKISE